MRDPRGYASLGPRYRNTAAGKPADAGDFRADAVQKLEEGVPPRFRSHFIGYNLNVLILIG